SCDSGKWNPSRPPIVFDSLSECSRVHTQQGIGGNFAQGFEPETESHHRLVYARVRLLRAIDHHLRQVGSSRHSLLANAELGMHLTRGSERIKRIGRRSVADDAKKIERQPEHLAQPVQRQLLELSRG